ncbi:MAG: hypothetical protein VCD00_09700 [Candidatus Hydrogenedentota bacterium]
MDERRVGIRRQDDRDRLEALGQTTSDAHERKTHKRQLRRAIRHACKAELTIEISHQRGGVRNG